MSQFRRRQFLRGALAFAAARWIPCSYAQGQRVYRIGYLITNSVTDPATGSYWQSMDQRLRELDYFEGRNLQVERRAAEGDLDRLPALATELTARKVEVIVVGTDLAALAAKKATSTTPIVFTAGGDPVRNGLVKSLAHPGGNVTGFTSFREDLVGKQMQLLRETVPQIKRVAVIYSSSAPLGLDALKAGAEGLNVSLHDIDTGLDNVLHAIEREKPGGLHVLLTASTFRNRVRIAEFALARRLPSVYGIAAHVEAGGLMSYSFNYSDSFRRAAEYVDRILKGAKPGELPVQMTTKFEMVINMKTASALGLKIPQSVLQRADRLIE